MQYQYLIDRIKSETKPFLKSKLLIAIILSCLLMNGIEDTFFVVVLSILGLAMYIYWKDIFDFKKAKEYFAKKER